MTPTTNAGKALLAREAYNSRAFALITPDAIVAIEQESSTASSDALETDRLARAFLEASEIAGAGLPLGRQWRALIDHLRATTCAPPPEGGTR